MAEKIRYISRYEIKVGENNEFKWLIAVYEHCNWELNPSRLDVDIKGYESFARKLWDKYKEGI